MKAPKNRSMPLTAAMVRFVDVAELIKSRSIADEVLRDIAGYDDVAVCIFDPLSRVGGLLHFMLPDSRINAARARTQPMAFADTRGPVDAHLL